MSRRKNFNINVKPRDVLVDIKGLSAGAVLAFLRFWMHHHLHGEPLPPAEEKVADVDEYFRELLDMKNVRTWRKARDELLAKARLRQMPDGRFYIGRTMRDAGYPVPDDDKDKGGGDSGSQGGGNSGGQGSLPLMRVVGGAVGKPVDGAGKAAASDEVRPNIATSSGEVPSNIERSSPDVAHQPVDITRNWVRPFIVSSTSTPFDHEVVVAVPFGAARARGDPATARA